MVKMKVVISNPPWPGEGYGVRTNVRWPHRRKDKALAFPIYLAYTSSLLKQNKFEVYAIDAVEKEFSIQRFIDEIRKINPSFILLEVSTPSIEYDLETTQEIKKNLPNTVIALCGPHATYFHKDILEKYKFIDIIIRNEFEYTTLNLCKSLKDKHKLNEVDGISFREKNKIIINKDADLIKNLDDLPLPDRESFKIENYQQAFYCGKKTALMISSKGCPYQCSFCIWPQVLNGHKHRTRSVKSVVNEIEYLIKNYNVDEIFFDDDTFAISKERIEEFCNEILKRNIKIPWVCMGRVNIINQEIIQLMKKAGCTQIFYGFESGSDKILKAVNKGITKEEMINAVRLTQKDGLVASGSFMFGLPDEDKETVKETINFAKKLHADFVQFTLAAPFPGTKFYEEAKSLDLLEIKSWSDLDGTKGAIIRTKYLSKKDLEGILRKAYISYYTSPTIILINLKKLILRREFKRLFRGIKSVIARILFYN